MVVDITMCQSVGSAPVPIIFLIATTITSSEFEVVMNSGHRYWFQP